MARNIKEAEEQTNAETIEDTHAESDKDTNAETTEDTNAEAAKETSRRTRTVKKKRTFLLYKVNEGCSDITVVKVTKDPLEVLTTHEEDASVKHVSWEE